jgi:hypothetical protein
MVTDEQPIRCTNCGKKAVGPRIVGASPVGTSLTMMPFVGAALPSPTAGSSGGLSRSFRRSRSAAAVRRPKAQLG